MGSTPVVNEQGLCIECRRHSVDQGLRAVCAGRYIKPLPRVRAVNQQLSLASFRVASWLQQSHLSVTEAPAYDSNSEVFVAMRQILVSPKLN